MAQPGLTSLHPLLIHDHQFARADGTLEELVTVSQGHCQGQEEGEGVKKPDRVLGRLVAFGSFVWRMVDGSCPCILVM